MKCRECGKNRFKSVGNSSVRCLHCGHDQLTEIAQARHDAEQACALTFAMANVELAHYNDEMEGEHARQSSLQNS